MLGCRLQQQSHDLVLCHADIHTANLLLAPDGSLFVVDWDQPVLAPKERDLLFVVGGTVGGFIIGSREDDLFFQGYGKTEIDWLALAYYRYEWIVADVGGFGEQVFLMDAVGDETKEDGLRLFRLLFAPGNIVESAHQLEQSLSTA
jgi:spectinomycin phosphotransferase